MHAVGSRNKPIQVLTAIYCPDSGPSGIGVAIAGVPAVSIGLPRRIHEQATGSAEYLYFRAVLRALQLGKMHRATDISILCPDESVVGMINREIPLEPGSPLALLYMRVRSLMHTYRLAEVRAVPRVRVEPARRLAVAASRMPLQKKEQPRKLFTPSG